VILDWDAAGMDVWGSPYMRCANRLCGMWSDCSVPVHGSVLFAVYRLIFLSLTLSFILQSKNPAQHLQSGTRQETLDEARQQRKLAPIGRRITKASHFWRIGWHSDIVCHCGGGCRRWIIPTGRPHFGIFQHFCRRAQHGGRRIS
jgi:hypothetical protein